MGEKRKYIISSEAQSVIATVKRNIRARLDQLGLSACSVARCNGKHPNWISDLLIKGRYENRMNVGVIIDVAAVLGVPFDALMKEGFNPARYRRPKWLESDKS